MIDYEKIDSATGQNWFDIDPVLQAAIARECPAEDLPWAQSKLSAIGNLAGGLVNRNADIVDRHPPELIREDRWGGSVSEVVYDPRYVESSRALRTLGFHSNFGADAQRRGRPTPRAVIAGAYYMVSGADNGLTLNLGINPIVARIVGQYGPPTLRDMYVAGLSTEDPDAAIVGGLFLTERGGGSDLANTVQAQAQDAGDGLVEITGEKWFCSNADADVMVVMARSIPDAPVSLFLVPRHREDGTLNIKVRKLKDKLGTRSCPTGEIEFDSSVGWPLRLQDAGATGLRDAMDVTNACRQGVAMMGLGTARRGLLESAIQAHHWKAKGRLLIDLPIIREQIVDLLVDVEAATALGFECNSDRYEPGHGVPRMLIPAAKSHLCRLGMSSAAQALELHGGNGYSNDFGLARLLRDAQANPIWEGTEHILALDVLRSIHRENAHHDVLARIDDALSTAEANTPGWAVPELHAVRKARSALAHRITQIAESGPRTAEANAVRLSQLLCRTVMSALLFEQAARDDGSPRSTLVAVRHVRRHLTSDASWTDRIAQELGRELLAHNDINERSAASAATAS
ncbi:MAG: acyl-CoA dehydrogenase family protein [Mycobacterium sp.]